MPRTFTPRSAGVVMTYAATTKVSAEKTKAEIEALVMKRRADNFASFSSRDAAVS